MEGAKLEAKLKHEQENVAKLQEDNGRMHKVCMRAACTTVVSSRLLYISSFARDIF